MNHKKALFAACLLKKSYIWSGYACAEARACRGETQIHY